jgi:hypothetical protein
VSHHLECSSTLVGVVIEEFGVFGCHDGSATHEHRTSHCSSAVADDALDEGYACTAVDIQRASRKALQRRSKQPDEPSDDREGPLAVFGADAPACVASFLCPTAGLHDAIGEREMASFDAKSTDDSHTEEVEWRRMAPNHPDHLRAGDAGLELARTREMARK